jgi:hypothetical protein
MTAKHTTIEFYQTGGHMDTSFPYTDDLSLSIVTVQRDGEGQPTKAVINLTLSYDHLVYLYKKGKLG